MKLVIQNFRRISSATIDLSRIALVAGKNEAGKTSIAQAAAALLTLDPVPIIGVPKSQAGVLLHSGAASGTAVLSSETGETTITWPNAKVKQAGDPPYASQIAAGMVSITDMDAKDRAKTLQAYLKASPVKADLLAALAPLKLKTEITDELWSLIEKNGWDATMKQISDKGTKLKGQWEAITGDNYGTKKAESWIPAGYSDDLTGASEDTLARIVTDAKDALEGAIANTAVDASKRGELETTADRLSAWKIDLLAAENATVDPAMGHQLTECEGFITELNGKRATLVAERDALPKPGVAPKGTACPHCKTVLEIRGNELAILQATVSESEIAERKTAIEEADRKIAGLDTNIDQHRTGSARLRSQIQTAEHNRLAKITECKQLVAEAEAAAKELESMGNGGPAAAPESVDEYRTAVATAEQRLQAFKAKTSADNIQRGILTNIKLQEKIGPTGVRSDVLTAALAGFNKSLEGLSTAAKWRKVELDSTFAPTYGGCVYLLLSESAKFRVRVVLQLALALLDKSQAVVVDASDILDSAGRNGLFMALLTAGLPALVCMTANSPPMDVTAAQTAWAADPSDENTATLKLALSSPPDLAKAGIGVSYWVEGGVVS